MRTFLLDIIPRIQRFSRKLDYTAVLISKRWVLLSEDTENMIIYLFSEKENQLRVAKNGKIRRGKWHYLGHDQLEIDVEDEPLLFKIAFLDDQLLALKLDNTNAYLLLVDEPAHQQFLNQIQKLNEFLEENYFRRRFEFNDQIKKIDAQQTFNQEDFPSLKGEIENLGQKLKHYPSENATDIIIAFAKDHTLNNEWFNTNRELANDISRREISLALLESIFNASKGNIEFQNGLILFLRKALEKDKPSFEE
jgi:hypothetical protein